MVELEQQKPSVRYDEYGYEIEDDYFPNIPAAPPRPPLAAPPPLPAPEAAQQQNDRHSGSMSPLQRSHEKQSIGLSPAVKRSKLMSPISRLEDDNPVPQTEKKENTSKLDAMLSSPKQNILVSRIIDVTQRDPNLVGKYTHRMNHTHAFGESDGNNQQPISEERKTSTQVPGTAENFN